MPPTIKGTRNNGIFISRIKYDREFIVFYLVEALEVCYLIDSFMMLEEVFVLTP